MDSNKIKLILILAAALFGALYLGIAAATAQFEAVLWVVGGVGITVCLALGRRIWLLLPFASSIGLVLPLPGSFSTIFMTEAVVIGFCSMLFFTRRLPLQFKFTELEFWCLLFVLSVAQAYMRNPVGLNIFGSSTVGAKPYAVLVMLTLTATLLMVLKIEPKELKWWVTITMVATWANFALGIVSKLVPSIGYFLHASFATDASDGDSSGSRDALDEGAASRIAFVRLISINLANWISSRISPLVASFSPLWAPLVIFTIVGAAYSGYRSQLATVAMTYLVGVYYRGGLRQVVLSFFLGAAGLVLLALVNLISPLPPNVQRALTFLPGTWEQRYKDDAKGSTDWRTELWMEALKSDKYIRNKLLGDGLGMSMEQLQQTLFLQDKLGESSSGFDYHRESILISGDYHSGPVQTIRTCGYLGLAILVIGMFRVTVHAHRQIIRCRNTEWYGTALFIGNVYIWLPLGWIFIFGSFSGGADALLMGAAMVRMLEKNLPIPHYVVRKREPFVLGQHRASSADEQKPIQG
ncbi:MAG: hypothetical protein ABIS50_22960 [Luteolibacter sp.]|uniref:hypothetical protein n=1 Tax=Luteolibacter sp. TaxID=1962973 RepID=UPI003262D50E